MIVIADTSTICYLILIEEIEILAQLFGKIVIPNAVKNELIADDAPDPVKDWIRIPPLWLEEISLTLMIDSSLSKLHPGEQEVIILAEEIAANLVILDEKSARKIAWQRGLKIIGLYQLTMKLHLI